MPFSRTKDDLREVIMEYSKYRINLFQSASTTGANGIGAVAAMEGLMVDAMSNHSVLPLYTRVSQ